MSDKPELTPSTPWTVIISSPADGPENMALDEALFSLFVEGKLKTPVFRIYSWSVPWVTMGYFQRHEDFKLYNLPITRRLTGGLSVKHGKDVSYAFIAGESFWPNIYNQEETYRLIHSGIKEGLNSLGHAAEFYQMQQGTQGVKNNICVETVFPYDLHIRGRKIVGSSQRQRGRNILIQGSIHIAALRDDFPATTRALAGGWKKALGIKLEEHQPEPEVLALKEDLKRNKYLSDDWNHKI